MVLVLSRETQRWIQVLWRTIIPLTDFYVISSQEIDVLTPGNRQDCQFLGEYDRSQKSGLRRGFMSVVVQRPMGRRGFLQFPSVRTPRPLFQPITDLFDYGVDGGRHAMVASPILRYEAHDGDEIVPSRHDSCKRANRRNPPSAPIIS